MYSLPLLFCSPVLLAWQAGGGGSFSGGGGGGGFSGGGGGGDDGFLFFWLVRLAFEAPLIGVPLLIVAAVVFFLAANKGNERRQERTIRLASPRRALKRSGDWATELQRGDPEFDLHRFFARVRVAFTKAQDGWCAQDLSELQPFVSDGVFERFSLQLEEQRIDGVRQRMRDLALGELSLLHLDTSDPFESLTVSVPFDAKIDKVELDSEKPVSGSLLQRTQFRECWSFVRRRGATSIDGDGLIEGKCPGCKAPLSMNQSAKCSYCDAFVRSGAFDWVLAEITQASEWNIPAPVGEVPGGSAYLKRDPGLSLQLLEDQASVAFWRRCAAERLGTSEPLFSIATTSFRKRHAEGLASATSAAKEKGEAQRAFVGDCAVGGVRTTGIVSGSDQDSALVEVVWDGRRGRVHAGNGRAVPSYEKGRRIRRSLFVFVRESGQATPIETTFTTAHCPGCGAVDEGGTRSTCSYCDRPRDGDPRRWLLDRVLAAGSPEARALHQDARSKSPASLPPHGPVPSPSGLLAWAAAGVRAGGALVHAEETAFFALAHRAGVSQDRARELLAVEASEAAPSPADATEAKGWLVALAKISLADGHLSVPEKKFLRRAAEHFDLARADLEKTIKTARGELYLESRRS